MVFRQVGDRHPAEDQAVLELELVEVTGGELVARGVVLGGHRAAVEDQVGGGVEDVVFGFQRLEYAEDRFVVLAGGVAALEAADAHLSGHVFGAGELDHAVRVVQRHEPVDVHRVERRQPLLDGLDVSGALITVGRCRGAGRGQQLLERRGQGFAEQRERRRVHRLAALGVLHGARRAAAHAGESLLRHALRLA